MSANQMTTKDTLQPFDFRTDDSAYTAEDVEIILADAHAHYESQVRQLSGLERSQLPAGSLPITEEKLAQMIQEGFMAGAEAAMAKEVERLTAPIDMVLHCPKCGEQHIDEPEQPPAADLCAGNPEDVWTNPPHRSHLCKLCGHQWRPADVATNGVAAVKTKGKNDSPLARPLRDHERDS